MGGIKLSVHPLFFLLGLYYALTGRIFIFIIYTTCAVVHELGHSICAGKLGYRLDKITLMPFGAVVSGQIHVLNLKDQIKIAYAGPFTNLSIGLLFVATWWLYPECYAYTDVVAYANFSLALVNFLPVYPLDGGRVLYSSIALKYGDKKANITCTVVGCIFTTILIVLFIVSCFYTFNISLLFFSLFLLFGLFGRGKKNKYAKIYTSVNKEKLKKGMIVKRQAIEKSATVKKLISILDQNAVNEVIVYDGEREVAVLKGEKLKKVIESGDLYSKISRFLA